MKKLLYAAWMSSLLVISAKAQKVEIFGYFEPQLFAVDFKEGSAHLFSNKLRVDLQSSQYENAFFAANFDYINYSGLKTWNVLYFVPDDIAGLIDPYLYDYFQYTYNDSIFLDNAYARVSFKRFDLTAGRQQISLGTGYVWNPTDLFNYKSITDPTYEQPGHDAIRLDAPIWNRYNFSLIYGPGKDWKSATKLVKVKGGAGHFDFSAIFIEMSEDSTDYFSVTIPAGVAKIYKRRLFGGDFVGEILGLGVWGEFGYNRVENRKNFSEIDAGFDYTFDNQTYILAEYYHNERAKGDYHNFGLVDWLNYISGEIKTISKDNYYLYADYPVTDLIHVNNSVVGSANDGSFALIPGVDYNIRENIELEFIGGFTLGKDNTAYTSEQGQSGLLRMRIYF